LYLNNHGLNVIPVIQDFHEVEYYCSNAKKYPYVAVGSGCRMMDRNKKKGKRIKETVRRLHNSGIKVHLFAEASYDFMKDIPVYSSDATSYQKWTTLFYCCFFDTVNDKEVQLSLNWKNSKGKINKDYYRTHYLQEEYAAWLYQNFEISIPELFLGNNLLLANSYYYCCLEKLITAKHIEFDVFK
jgi:hypothetical protein